MSYFKVLRERLIITHESPYARKIMDEITVMNTEKGTNLRQVIIYRDKFMPGLKVLDGADNELVIMPNNYTKELLRLNAVEKNEYDTYNKVLNHKLYAVWIQFPKGKEVGYNETIIIKFVYYDQETPKEVPAKDAKKNWKFFFSVPRFSVIKKTLTGQNVDTFIVINVCEELEVDHQFVKKDKVSANGERTSLTDKDRFYIDVSKQVISMRIPPVRETIDLEMTYDVMIGQTERKFFVGAFFTLLSVSAALALLATGVLPQELYVAPLKEHISTIFGGLITTGVASIGFMKNQSTNKTRFIFAIPMVVAALGFLLQK